MLSPQVWSQETVSVTDGNESGLQSVFQSSGGTVGLGVDIFQTSQLQQFLDSWGSDDTGTSWSWNQSNDDGTTLTGGLGSQRVGLTQVVTPVTSSDWDDRQLGNDDTGSDGTCDFLSGLDTQTDVTVGVTDNDDSLESGSLTGSGLLLDWLDVHDFVSQTWQQGVDDLELLDWQRVQEDLLDGGDLTGLDKST